MEPFITAKNRELESGSFPRKLHASPFPERRKAFGIFVFAFSRFPINEENVEVSARNVPLRVSISRWFPASRQTFPNSAKVTGRRAPAF